MRPTNDGLAFGVDLASNFGFQWASCSPRGMFSAYYPGKEAFSENETLFVKETLERYKDNARVYISLRKDGHSLLYPFAYNNLKPDNEVQIQRFASEITNKVNQRAGVIQIFTNESIFISNGRPRCWSSIDFAYDLGIPYCYEMRVFLGREPGARIATFQEMPRGYYFQLLMGYVSGLKKVYDLVLREKNIHSSLI